MIIYEEMNKMEDNMFDDIKYLTFNGKKVPTTTTILDLMNLKEGQLIDYEQLREHSLHFVRETIAFFRQKQADGEVLTEEQLEHLDKTEELLRQGTIAEFG